MDAPIKLANFTAPTESTDQALYEVRKKIYPRAVHGKFAFARWAAVLLTQLVFYGCLLYTSPSPRD